MLLLDLLAYLTTPCSARARSLGFLSSTLQVQARYRRCRHAWEPHLQRTRRVILAAAARCPRRRQAVIFGAGLLHDVPLRELAGMFAEVTLVDLVFPRSTRRAAALFPNVRCLDADVAGIIDTLAAAVRDPAAPLPTSAPTRFLHEPTLDLTVSVNLLSQLPVIPTRALARRPGREEAALRDWSRAIQQAHLAYLRQLPGHTALITDTIGQHRDRTGAIVEEWDNLHGLPLPSPDETWEWALAPAPEIDPRIDHLVRVAAFLDWKQTRPV